MANPQPDYFVRISQELYEQLNRADLGTIERPILDHVIGETYGHNRKMALLTWADIARAIAKERQNVDRAGRVLIARRFLIQDYDEAGAMLLGPQKDWDQWKPRGVKGASEKASHKASGKASSIEHHHDAREASRGCSTFLISKNRSITANDLRPESFKHDMAVVNAYPSPLAAAQEGHNPSQHRAYWAWSEDRQTEADEVYLEVVRPLLSLSPRTFTDAGVLNMAGCIMTAVGGMPSDHRGTIAEALKGYLEVIRDEKERRGLVFPS